MSLMQTLGLKPAALASSLAKAKVLVVGDVILDRYFEEGDRRWKMMGIEFTNFHRTLSTYIRAYRHIGFAIEEIIEPTVEVENLKRFPELEDELRVPNFIVVALAKPANV